MCARASRAHALGGYLLKAGPEQLDVVRFERLLSEGRGLLAGGDAASAAARLREALALWRGPPLADLVLLEFVQPEIRRLEELRLLALMERIDADLALGAGAELIGELEGLVASNPLQERLRAQLMLALYRAGRQAEALAAYRQISELLRDQLGLEPSPELRDLERAILNHDTALQPAPAARPSPMVSALDGTVREARLPVPATTFLGRERELADLVALLGAPHTRLLTLTGAGGSGKTRLALRLAETTISEYSDGVWFVGFADISNPELIAPTICQALALSEHAQLEPIDRLTHAIAERRILLVLDNLEQLVDGTPILGNLIAGCPGLTLVVTSREPLHLAGERQYEVPVLAQTDAVELFTARARAVAHLLSVDAANAAAICDRLDRLPLAIELVAARTKALSPIELLTRLDRSLPLLTGGPRDAPHRQRTLEATIDWSYQVLSPAEQHLFARLAVFAGGCTLPAAEDVCGANLDILQSLIDRSLLRTDRERYWMLQTIREYAIERLGQTGETHDLRRARARWFVELVDAEGVAPPAWPDQSSLIRLGREQANFMSALEWAADAGEIEIAARLTSSLTAVWIMLGQLHEATRWITFVLQHEEKYPSRLAAHVVSAGRLLAHYRGRWNEEAPLAKRALVRWRELDDPEAIQQAMTDAGAAALKVGDLTSGRAELQQAKASGAPGDRRETARQSSIAHTRERPCRPEPAVRRR